MEEGAGRAVENVSPTRINRTPPWIFLPGSNDDIPASVAIDIRNPEFFLKRRVFTVSETPVFTMAFALIFIYSLISSPQALQMENEKDVISISSNGQTLLEYKFDDEEKAMFEKSAESVRSSHEALKSVVKL